jgi:hypothetical protein
MEASWSTSCGRRRKAGVCACVDDPLYVSSDLSRRMIAGPDGDLRPSLKHVDGFEKTEHQTGSLDSSSSHGPFTLASARGSDDERQAPAVGNSWPLMAEPRVAVRSEGPQRDQDRCSAEGLIDGGPDARHATAADGSAGAPVYLFQRHTAPMVPNSPLQQPGRSLTTAICWRSLEHQRRA